MPLTRDATSLPGLGGSVTLNTIAWNYCLRQHGEKFAGRYDKQAPCEDCEKVIERMPHDDLIKLIEKFNQALDSMWNA